MRTNISKETAKDDCSLAQATRDQINALADLLARKGADYGGSAFVAPMLAPKLTSQTALLVRMSDKIKRLQTLAAKKGAGQVKEETFSDTIRDLAGYCILYLAADSRGEEYGTTHGSGEAEDGLNTKPNMETFTMTDEKYTTGKDSDAVHSVTAIDPIGENENERVVEGEYNAITLETLADDICGDVIEGNAPEKGDDD